MPDARPSDAHDGLVSAAELSAPPVPVTLVDEAGAAASLAALGPAVSAFAQASEFKGQAGRLLVLPGPDGAVARVLFGLGEAARAGPRAVRGLPTRLPPGDYALENPPAAWDLAEAALAWAEGAHFFDRYKAERGRARPRLAVHANVDFAAVRRVAHACALARDMVNTPANDMGPAEIAAIAAEIAHAHGATCTVTLSDALIPAGYPAVHAVGRAATPARGPRMVELAWRGSGAGDASPLLALVGKGVAFDTGGLDLKTAGMKLMKKDMGGAAHALALARMVMGADLPVRLAVLVPAVENAVSADAVRPSDVIATRAGLSVEVGNTDAEGRLVLADALTRAGELAPDLTIDLATLTGAARVALGPEVVPYYTADDALAAEIAAASAAVADPLWRMPLWDGYGEALNSEVADLRNDPEAWAQAGSVTAALFLRRFAPTSGAWVHLDIYAWNPRARPGWPAGGEAQAIRALFKVIEKRYSAAIP